MEQFNHNGGPAITDDIQIKPRWVKLNPVEFIEGMQELTWEQRGFYCTAIFKMYSRLDGIPYDERAGATMLGCDLRFYRRMRDSLIAAGKLYVDDTTIRNKRTEEAIAEACREIRAKQRAANIRWGNLQPEGENMKTSPELPGEVREKSGRSSSALFGKSDTKPNEINKTGMHVHAVKANSAYENQNQNVDRVEYNNSGRDSDLGMPETRVSGEFPNEDQPKVEKPRRRRLRKVYTPEFERFWRAYPDTRNNCKQDAFAEWLALTSRERLDAQASLDAFMAYCREREKDGYRAVYAERYLSQRRFESFVASAGEPAPGPNGKRWGWWVPMADRLKTLSQDHWRRALVEHQPNGIWPWWLFGPPPGGEGSFVPTEIAREFGLIGKYGTDCKELPR